MPSIPIQNVSGERGRGQNRLLATFLKLFFAYGMIFFVFSYHSLHLNNDKVFYVPVSPTERDEANDELHIGNDGNVLVVPDKVSANLKTPIEPRNDVSGHSHAQHVSIKQKEDEASQTNTEGSSSYLTMYGEHRVKPALEKIPKWLSDYFAWHQDQVANANDDTKYLVVTCIGTDKCGGLSDRLRVLPFHLLAASKVNRVLCIYWSKPFGLEHLLQPPKGGMDWRCPAKFDSLVNKEKNIGSRQQKNYTHYRLFDQKSRKNGDNAARIAETVLTFIKQNNERFASIGLTDQDFIKINGLNNVFNAYSYKELMPSAEKWFHVDLSEHIYRILFEPIKPISRMINATMTRLGLVEGEYISVHVRARYPTNKLMNILGKDAKKHDFGTSKHPFEGKLKKHLVELAENAVMCGALLDSNDSSSGEANSPVFFSSDNVDLSDYITKHNVTIGNNPKKEYRPVIVDQRDEIKHLASDHHPDVDHSDYYPIIEDLFIMGGSRCVSHGIGSFGAFAAGLSGNRCRSVHRDYSGKSLVCPNFRQIKLLRYVTDDGLMFGERVQDTYDGRLDAAKGYFWDDAVKMEPCFKKGCDMSDPALAGVTKYL